MKTPSLRARVVIIGTGVFAVVLLLVGYFVYVNIRGQLGQALEETLAARAQFAVNVWAETDGSEELARRFLELGLPADVIGPDGSVVQPPDFDATAGDLAPPPRVSQEEALPDGSSIVVYASHGPTDQQLRDFWTILVIALLGGLVLATIGLRRAVMVGLAPLDDVIAAAERRANGESGERLRPTRPNTEVGRVAGAFDEMLDALEGAIDEAEESEERMRRFVGDASHQLRTPITSMRAAVEMLLRTQDPEERDRIFTHLLRESARATNIVAALLRIARLDQARPPEQEETDLLGLCRTEAERMESLAPHLTADVEVGTPPPILLAETELLRELITNLLDNARRHAQSHVTLSVDASDGAVEVVVADDGPGVPPEARELVFERFATLDGAGGAGLGLAIARGIARLHGGDLVCEDRGFVVRLPATDDARVPV